MMQRVLFAGGGTGGHLFPGIAVCEELRRRLPELETLFIGTNRGIEARVLSGLEERFEAIDVKPLLGRTPVELWQSVAKLPGSGAHAFGLVRRFRPDLAIGLGGYAAGPVMLAAAALRVPCALLEQNAHVGLTNRLLSRVVGRAYLTFDETAYYFGSRRARVLGNPVRRAFVEAARAAHHDPVGSAARARRILIFGGSQGARVLNRVVPEALARAGIAEQGIGIVHQTGADALDEVKRRYGELGIAADVRPFIDDIARAYTGASLVIARAGATTLAELCAIGRPSILVPLPTAAEDHQTKNAIAMESAGAAVAVREHDLTPAVLAEQVSAILGDSARRQAMAQAALRRGRPDAAAAIVDDLFEWLHVPSAAMPDPEPGPPEPESPGGEGPSAGAPVMRGATRRARVKRCELRLTAVDHSSEAIG